MPEHFFTGTFYSVLYCTVWQPIKLKMVQYNNLERSFHYFFKMYASTETQSLISVFLHFLKLLELWLYANWIKGFTQNEKKSVRKMDEKMMKRNGYSNRTTSKFINTSACFSILNSKAFSISVLIPAMNFHQFQMIKL